MPDIMNRQVVLKSRPAGEPTEANFELIERPLPPVGEGEVLCRTIYLSLDPYMRGRMNAGRSYADPVKVGAVMCGGTVSQVVESRHPNFAPGDLVLGYDGWQAYGVSRGEGLGHLDAKAAPISYALGVLGMPGMTAYVGMLDIGQPKPGESVVVSAAAGAVGSVAGQIAKIVGGRVIGTAGTDEKCDHAVKVLGFDACVNYKTQDLVRGLRQACPDGIDVYFDNVGGPVLEAVLRQINPRARVAMIGLISQYNATALAPGPNLMPLLVKRAMIKGMIVSDHKDREAAFLADVSRWLKEGKIKYREDIVEGLASAPAAFLGLFHGRNFGKLLIRVSPDPTRR